MKDYYNTSREERNNNIIILMAEIKFIFNYNLNS